MSKKNQNKIAYNILNLLHIENNTKKTKNIPFPMTKLKSSISSYTLFLNQNKKPKNSNTNNNNHQKNLNKKNILSNKTKYLNSTKTTEFM
jgi:hypothetical protein